MQDPMPIEYLSMRITTPHSTIDRLIKNVFYDCEWYIMYPHSGRNGDNEHVHAFIPRGDALYKQRYRDRVAGLVGTGNKYYSSKSCKNGIAQAIQYGSKEGTVPITRGNVQQWINDSPLWIPGGVSKKRKKPADFVDYDGEPVKRLVKITYWNIVNFAAHYYKRQKLTKPCMKETIRSMLLSKEYTFCLREPISPYQEAEFLVQIGAEESVTNCIDQFFGITAAKRDIEFFEAKKIVEKYEKIFRT